MAEFKLTVNTYHYLQKRKTIVRNTISLIYLIAINLQCLQKSQLFTFHISELTGYSARTYFSLI
jgi:hypothetical protein